jgi:hypothetical protein
MEVSVFGAGLNESFRMKSSRKNAQMLLRLNVWWWQDIQVMLPEAYEQFDQILK